MLSLLRATETQRAAKLGPLLWPNAAVIIQVLLTSDTAVSTEGFTSTTVWRTSLWYWRVRWPLGSRKVKMKQGNAECLLADTG